MGVDALGKYLNTEAEIAAVEEGKTPFILQWSLFNFCQIDDYIFVHWHDDKKKILNLAPL